MRLIDADAFFENYPELAIEPYINAPTVTVEDWVRDMPLDDINLLYKTLTPHGFWIRKPVERDLLYNTGIKFTCPFCGEGNSYGEPPHCMYCGARLDKEAEDANT